jgi:hypothetical protein
LVETLTAVQTYKICDLITEKWYRWLLLLLPVLPASLYSQEGSSSAYKTLKENAEIKFGPPASLLNGEKYYYPYGTALGTPYLPSQGGGSLQIRGTVYTHQQLKYDIYNQQLVLEYHDLTHPPVSIVVSIEWLDSFTLGDKIFKKYAGYEGKLRLGQAIYEGKFSCIYFWKKTYSPELQNGTKRFEFSDPERTAFILNDQQWTQFSGKGSFKKAFPKVYQEPVRQLIKQSRIRIRKATDREMRSLMELINQIPGSDE